MSQAFFIMIGTEPEKVLTDLLSDFKRYNPEYEVTYENNTNDCYIRISMKIRSIRAYRSVTYDDLMGITCEDYFNLINDILYLLKRDIMAEEFGTTGGSYNDIFKR